ncbi:2-iminobutanoate/2-iminopropanoate deaminase [Lamellibrachia satsuma]|nr:2-iminobutanoate/2-iminopropanoate deaminase [Lamellibrachia satsuma]
MASVIRKIVSTVAAPKPVGPYSQAVVVDKTVYVSGQLGMLPGTDALVDGGVEAEAEQTLKNLQAVLKGAGVDMGSVIKTTVLLENITDWPKVNTVYEKYFTNNYPARAAYQVAALPKGAKVEIEAVAVIGNITDVS